MEAYIYKAYVDILKEELVPAMGCTEPIAIAYAAAIARKVLGTVPIKIQIRVSGNIIKNVKSVIVPHTGSLKGIRAAAAAGIIAGNADWGLEVISDVTGEQIAQISSYLNEAQFTVSESVSDKVFDIDITVTDDQHSARVHIEDRHTNVVLVQKDDAVLYRNIPKLLPDEGYNASGTSTAEKTAAGSSETVNGPLKGTAADRSLLTVERIAEFADKVDMADIETVIERQITYNTAIAREGLSGTYGACIGKVLLQSYGNSVSNRAKAWAAAGSDARMNGCEMPVIINSGSGNQGMTASLPVIIYAEELKASKEMLYRALVVSNFITIHLKSGIGCLSAYCGAISAGCGAGAGITYLYGGKYKEIAHTIVNALAINSGVVCDGAKASCAAKIASAVEAGLLGMEMYRHGSQFYGGDGIVTKGVEKTIRNISTLAREGMAETDKKIIHIMMEE